MPSVLFTYSATDTRSPELVKLIATDPESNSGNKSTIYKNLGRLIFFHEHINKFAKYFYVDILGATDYWSDLSGSIMNAHFFMVFLGY